MSTILINLTSLGNILVGFYFAFYGFWNIYHWIPILSMMTKDGIPHPYLLLPLGIAWQISLGIMIMFNIYASLAAFLLIPFTIASVIIFHPFWRWQGELRSLNLSIFIANVTVTLGSLLFIITKHACI